MRFGRSEWVGDGISLCDERSFGGVLVIAVHVAELCPYHLPSILSEALLLIGLCF